MAGEAARGRQLSAVRQDQRQPAVRGLYQMHEQAAQADRAQAMAQWRAGKTSWTMSAQSNHTKARRMVEEFHSGEGRPASGQRNWLFRDKLIALGDGLPCPQCSSPRTLKVHHARLNRSFVECVECGEQFQPPAAPAMRGG